MYESMRIDQLRKGQEFLYNGQRQVVVKSEPNMLGFYDVWYNPIALKNVACPAHGHLVTEGNHAVLIPPS